MGEEIGSKLRVIEGGISGGEAPSTNLQEQEPPKVLEKQGFVTRVRRALSKIAKKLDTNPNNIPPPGKAF